MRRALRLVPPLVVFWLLLSEHYTTLLLTLGALSVLIVVWLIRRIELVDRIDLRVRLAVGAPLYAGWLAWQILVSSLAVVRQVWAPRLDPRPVVGVTQVSGLSEIATVAYANSITLTPGTLSMQVNTTHIEVHALRESELSELRAGRMLKRLQRLRRQ